MSDPSISDALRTLRLLWFNFLGAGFIYLAIPVFLTKPAGFTLDEGQFHTFLIAFGACSLAEAVLSVLMRRLIVQKHLSGRGDDTTPEGIINAYRTGSLVSWAMAMSISIYGLVLYILFYQLWPLITFVAIGTVLIAVAMPRRSALEELVAQVQPPTQDAAPTPQDPPQGPTW